MLAFVQNIVSCIGTTHLRNAADKTVVCTQINNNRRFLRLSVVHQSFHEGFGKTCKGFKYIMQNMSDVPNANRRTKHELRHVLTIGKSQKPYIYILTHGRGLVRVYICETRRGIQPAIR